MHKKSKLLFPELSYALVGAAIDVHTELGPGLLERVYHEAMCEELRLRGLPFQTRLKIPVAYKGKALGFGYEADLVIDQKIVVELKSVDSLEAVHTAQTLTYMRLLNLPVGYVFNFRCRNLVHDGKKRLILTQRS